jgi:aspartyl protease family protein
MATGFMLRHSIALALALASQMAAADVALIGTFGRSAAILSIDSGPPKTVKVGQRAGAVTLISVEQDRAIIEVDGKRRVLQRGQGYSGGGASGAQSVTLSAGAGGHFMADGQVNGGAIRFVVDTGATSVAIPASDAARLGIDFRKGRRVMIQTAAGPTSAYAVKFDSVRVGAIDLTNVDGMVVEQAYRT